MSINEDQQQSLEEAVKIREERPPEPSEQTSLETEGVFDPDLERPDPNFLAEMESFLDDPMKPLIKLLGQYLESIKPPMAFTAPPMTEHKVRIFRLNDRTVLAEVEAEIEAFLKEGYCCHLPAVCNDFLIMDFSRRKDERQERQTNNDGSDKENKE